ncbi:regulator of G-protein signaling 9-binding protein [Echeneis naucrates]|uniref:regulator of G-protein signaling 9-binding protein n=1 Tax=Echeneis naucrates TaxID=173247 RepID=UPI00111346CF|nr:regulator of G-protein signaling 9-binding protein B-like [Echeneis naucrates]
MPLVNNKVGDDCTLSTDKTLADGKTLVDSLIKVVACYRNLASCVGGCTDSLQLRDDLRQTREKAQKLAVSTCQHLTSHLRDKSLPQEQRRELELLWVAFSSSLELLHVDMCKVFSMGDIFCLANTTALVQTGLQGGGSEVAARALSLPDLNQAQTPADGLENQERSAMEKEISQIDHMIDDMEMKVNVLRWMVEPHGPQYAEPLSSTDSASLALLTVDEEQPGHQPLCQRSRIFVFLLLFAVVLVAATLSVCVVFFS